MAFSKLTYLLTCALLLQAVLGANPLYHFCSSSQNFTTPGPYDLSLNKLLAALYIKVPPTGFGSATVSTPTNQDAAAYGLGLCRGDVSPSDCKACVAEAGGELRQRCPTNKGAIIWYDNCLVKYSDESFFGQIDNRNKFYMWNLRNVSDAEVFNGNVKGLLSRLAEEAAAASAMFAGGESEAEAVTKLYGMAQCTRDLTASECKTCLDGVIGELPSCCDAKEGGRVVGGSCNVRYEIYPFLNTYN